MLVKPFEEEFVMESEQEIFCIINKRYFLDSCAFDPKYYPENLAAEFLLDQYKAEKIELILTHSNQREIDHPNTPDCVKVNAKSLIFTIEDSLTPAEKSLQEKIELILRGNARHGKHKDDARHLFEASKYLGHFVTTDQRILAKASEIHKLCALQILLPVTAASRMGFSVGS